MKVSFVVPAYNAEHVIDGCLDSLLSQATEEIEVEVVCVDDGSQDATLEVLRNRSAADPRIRVITQANAGVSAARNTGLDAASGDVILFIDADDALVEGTLEKIIPKMEDAEADCLVFGMVVEPKSATPLTLSHRLHPRDAVYEEDPRSVIFKEATHPYAFRVAFSHSFLKDNNLRFDERLTLGEDEAFLMVAYCLAHRVVLVSDQLYIYRMDPNSASHKDNASDEVLPEKLEKHLALVSSVMHQWRKHGLEGYCDSELIDWCLDLLMLDASRLDDKSQWLFYRRLWAQLSHHFGSDGGTSIASPAARPCLASILHAASSRTCRGPVIDKMHLVSFYVASRGAKAVAERAFAKLRGKGAY